MSAMLRTIQAQRALMKVNTSKFFARSLSSTHSVVNPNPHGWKSWKDIPDSALPKPADPTNPLYETKQYKRVQKKRIWYQIDDGTPVYLKEGWSDRVKVYGYFGLLAAFLAYEYYIIFTKVSV